SPWEVIDVDYSHTRSFSASCDRRNGARFLARPVSYRSMEHVIDADADDVAFELCGRACPDRCNPGAREGPGASDIEAVSPGRISYVSEVIVQIFELRGPTRHEHPFGARAGRPTRAQS